MVATSPITDTLWTSAALDTTIEPKLTREQLVDMILEFNPTTNAEFLSGFDRGSLLSYLERLNRQHEPRCGTSRWVRRGDTPAISQGAIRKY
jgi:hypothetical protein